jgi:two-component sensor histidine kinase
MAMRRDGGDRRFTFVSRSSERLTGVTVEAALRDPGVLDRTILPESLPALQAAEREAVAALKAIDVEVGFRRPDGSPGWSRIISAPREVPDGSLLWDGMQVDITERKLAEEHQRLLINELNHRVKNTLATVQSIAAQTLRNAPTKEEARDAFEARLMALSRAHDVLTRENWEGASLAEIVAEAVAPYRNLREDRVHLSGSDVRLPPRMALAIGMALQELATNAVKYGALSNDTGVIWIDWTVDSSNFPSRLHLRWAEAGGPPVAQPTRRGFGSRLIERSLAQDLDGTVAIAFDPAGVVCTVDAPVAQS